MRSTILYIALLRSIAYPMANLAIAAGTIVILIYLQSDLKFKFIKINHKSVGLWFISVN